MASVELQSVVKNYGGAPVVNQVSLSVQDGEFLTLLGPSGCGKTTCLRMVAGFIAPDSGVVRIAGQDVTRVPAYRRNTGMVFQQYALFPHLSVAQNLAFGLQLRKVNRHDIRQRVEDALERIRLPGYGNRYPDQLSGGQKQRVALARALIFSPRVLLLDEPLGALDQKLREELQQEIKRIQKEVGITTIFVTHDQNEALSLSDRVVVMRQGGIVQIGAPKTLYDRPADRYVASFIGKINLLSVRAKQDPERDGWLVGRPGGAYQWRVELDAGHHPEREEPLLLALRPERIQLGAELPNRIRGQVEQVTYAGDGWLVDVRAEDDVRIVAKVNNRVIPVSGEAVTLSWSHEDALLLPDEATA